MIPAVLRKRKRKKIYKPILKSAKSWPVVQMAEKRDEFIQLGVEESFENLLEEKRGKSLREELEMTVFREKQRVKNNSWKVDPKDDKEFWSGMQKKLSALDNLEETHHDPELKK